MKLHWSPRSPFVRKVTIAAHELGLSDRIELVRSTAAISIPNPVIMADNPLSKIPTLVLDDGTAIIDSRTIVEFLDSLAGGGQLVPAAGPDRWRTLSRQALGDGLSDLLVLWRNEREKPHPLAAWLDAFDLKAAAALDRLEAIAPELHQHSYSAAHIAIGCALSYLDFRFEMLGWRRGRPALAAWHETFRQRPSSIATEISE